MGSIGCKSIVESAFKGFDARWGATADEGRLTGFPDELKVLVTGAVDVGQPRRTAGQLGEVGKAFQRQLEVDDQR